MSKYEDNALNVKKVKFYVVYLKGSCGQVNLGYASSTCEIVSKDRFSGWEIIVSLNPGYELSSVYYRL